MTKKPYTVVERMRVAVALAIVGLAMAASAPCWAQFDPLRRAGAGERDEAADHQPLVARWRVGVKLTGGTAAGKDVTVAIPIPTDWPEQRVVLVDQQVSPQFQNFQVRSVDPGAAQVVARTPSLNANQQLELILTFQVEVAPVAAPKETASLVVPPRVTRELKPYMENSREVTYRNAKLTALVNEIVDRDQPAWLQVQALCNWIRENIETREEKPATTVECFLQRGGAPEDIVGLFVAMCRYIKVPARMVWVEGTQYAEFYLVDAEGQGRWYPCHILGLAEFGAIHEPRVILQKGDSIKVPERELPQRYVAEFARVRGAPPAHVEFVQELLPGQ